MDSIQAAALDELRVLFSDLLEEWQQYYHDIEWEYSAHDCDFDAKIRKEKKEYQLRFEQLIQTLCKV